jgi:hypothetical protein
MSGVQYYSGVLVPEFYAKNLSMVVLIDSQGSQALSEIFLGGSSLHLLLCVDAVAMAFFDFAVMTTVLVRVSEFFGVIYLRMLPDF